MTEKWPKKTQESSIRRLTNEKGCPVFIAYGNKALLFFIEQTNKKAKETCEKQQMQY